MNTTLFKILAVAVVAVLALGVIGFGVAYAQNPAPNNPFFPGGMMGRLWGGQGSWEWMDAMHNWMISTGGMHTLVWDSLADSLGLTTDELYAELNDGKTVADLAEEKGLDREALVAGLESAHQDALAQAVTDGILTDEQAGAILAQMAGRYEWMLDNMGAGYGMMGGYFGQPGSRGQFAPGGCHGGFAPPTFQNNQ